MAAPSGVVKVKHTTLEVCLDHVTVSDNRQLAEDGMGRFTERQVDKQAERQTARQVDSQTHRHTGK